MKMRSVKSISLAMRQRNRVVEFSVAAMVLAAVMGLLSPADALGALTCQEAIAGRNLRPGGGAAVLAGAAPMVGIDSAKKYLLSYLAREDQPVPLDIEPNSFSPEQKNLRRLFINTPPGEFNTLWSLISKKEVLALAELVSAGMVQATGGQKVRMAALAEFIKKDEANSLWRGDHDSWSTFHSRFPEYRGPGYSNDLGGVIANVDTHFLTEIEKEIFKAARGKLSMVSNGRWYQRVIWHPYKVALRIRDFNNELRAKLTYVDEIREALRRELLQEANLQFTKEETEVFKGIFAKVEAERKEVIDAMELAYHGKITGTLGAFNTTGLDMYQVYANIHKHGVMEALKNIDPLADLEMALFEYDVAINEIRRSRGVKSRQEDEMDSVELRVRHRQMAHLSGSTHQRWLDVMSTNTGQTLTIDFHYYETVIRTRTGQDGKIETYTEQKRVDDSTVVSVSFYEVLVSRLSAYHVGASMTLKGHSSTIDAVYGKSAILKASEKTAELEAPFYDLHQATLYLDNVIEEHKKLILDSATMRTTAPMALAHMRERLAKIMDKLENLKPIVKMDSSQVRALWAEDNPEVFRARNKALLLAWEIQRERYEGYLEQLKRQEKELEIHVATLDHSKDINWLALRYYGRNTFAGLTAAGSGGATFMYYNDPHFAYRANELWMLLQNYISGF